MWNSGGRELHLGEVCQDTHKCGRSPSLLTTRSPGQECGEAAPEAGVGAVQEAGGRGWRRGSPCWDWELGRSPRLGQEEASTGEEEEPEQRGSRSVDNI